MDWNQTLKYVDYLVFCSCRLEPSLSAVLTQHWNIRWNIYVYKLIIKPLETYISISVNRRPNQQYQGRSRRQIHWRWSHSRCNRSHRDMRISRGIPVIDILWYNFSCWRYSGHVTTSRAPRLTSFTSIIKIAFHIARNEKCLGLMLIHLDWDRLLWPLYVPKLTWLLLALLEYLIKLLKSTKFLKFSEIQIDQKKLTRRIQNPPAPPRQRRTLHYKILLRLLVRNDRSFVGRVLMEFEFVLKEKLWKEDN